MNNKFLKGFFSEIESIPQVLQNSYLPSLDGLRGVAIIMVVLSHLVNTSRFYYDTVFNGHLGVLVFFVLSGFLITTLCIKEKVITKDISLKNFYIRRVLRIFPVAYLFILVVIILNYFFKLGISYINFIGTALYLINFTSYFRKYYHTYFTGHFWSLSVEEQFYLMMPIILKKNFRLYLWIVLIIVFVIPGFICLQYYFTSLNYIVFYVITHYLIKFHAIAVGCLFSVLTFKYSFHKSFVSRNKVIFNILAIFLMLYLGYTDFFSLRDVLTGVACSFLIGYILVSNIADAKDFIFRFLNSKYLKIVGTLSYSIYIWQEIFTSNDDRLPAFMVKFPSNIICIIIVSCLSYYFYERFFLKLKSKFSRVKNNKKLVVAS